MLPLVLFEDTVDDMERRFPHEDVVVDEVVCEDPDGAAGERHVAPDHDAEHREGGVVVQPVQALLSLHQVAEAVHQLGVQPPVLHASLHDLGHTLYLYPHLSETGLPTLKQL